MYLPPPIAKNRLEELTVKLRNQTISTDEKQEIINGHLRLIYSVICKTFNPNNRNDLFQEAVAAMVELLDVAAERMYDDNLTAYLMNAGLYAVKKWITKQRTVHMPVRTIRHQLKNGLNRSKKILKAVNQSEISEEHKAEIFKLPIYYQQEALKIAKGMEINDFRNYIRGVIFELLPIPKMKTALADEPNDTVLGENYAIPKSKEKPLVELREMLRLSTNSIMEQAILGLREQGYTYKEIGPQVGYSFNRIGQIIREIEERFDELNR